MFNEEVEDGFTTNLLRPMGSDPSQDGDYQQYGFNFHQVTYAASGVYDAAAAQKKDLLDDAYRKPPAGWGLSGYWQTASGAHFLGLVWGVYDAETTVGLYPISIDELD